MNIKELVKAIYIINKEAKRQRDIRESYEKKKKNIEKNIKKSPLLKDIFDEKLKINQTFIDGHRKQEEEYYNLKKKAIEKLVMEEKGVLVGKQKQKLGAKEKWHYVYEVGGYSLHQPIKAGMNHSNLNEVDDAPLTKKIESTRYNSNEVGGALKKYVII